MRAQPFASPAASHEAGHAVVAHGLDLDVRAALLGKGNHVVGHIEGAVLIETQEFERLSNDGRIAYSVAGYVAEHTFANVEGDIADYYVAEQRTAGPCNTTQFDMHRARASALDEYRDSREAWKAIQRAWDRVLAWQRESNVANAIKEIALRLDANRKVGIVNTIAARHGVLRPDPRLLPPRDGGTNV